jgi:hypothetical protein
MIDVLRRLRPLALVAVGLLMVTACREDLEGGAACPVLCPEQGLEVRDTVLYPVVLDSTLAGYPLIGSEPALILARRGDTLVTAGVARFDTLLSRITRGDTSQRTIIGIDTAHLAISISEAPVASDSVTIELYDVDTAVTGIDTAAVRQLFRSDRFISSVTMDADTIVGVRRVPVPVAFLEPKILGGQRVRFGIAVRADESVQLRILTAESQNAPILTYLARAQADTQTLSIVASSRQPPTPGASPTSFADYQVILQGAIPPTNLLAVGGVPGHRVYLRFDIPQDLLEENTIVRALFQVTQTPFASVDGDDTLQIVPRLVRATPVLDPEPGKAALVLGDVASFPMPALRTVPTDTGVKTLQIATALSVWRLDPDTTFTRAIVLQSLNEGLSPQAALFFPADPSVPQALWPRLQITYVPRAGFGLP